MSSRSDVGEAPQTCSERLESLLQAIEDPRTQGAAIYTRVDADTARASARRADERATKGVCLSPLDGALVSLKASIDVAGFTTTACSPALAKRAPATADAPLVDRLRAAGAIIVGSTQMTDLAFSGLGLNPNQRPLRNPRELSRVTGGSSSGAAASVAAGLADVAIGGDTGGSIRIPAALCGVTGFKPTGGRVSTAGSFPLSTTLDCFGPIARSVRACADAFSVLSGMPAQIAAEPGSYRFLLARGLACEGLDSQVGMAWEAAVRMLTKSSLTVCEWNADALFTSAAELDAIGVFTVPELLAALQDAGVSTIESVDPMVQKRLQAFAGMNAVSYARLLRHRSVEVERTQERLAHGEIILMPTVACVAPAIEDVRSVDQQIAVATRLVRNTRTANLLDLPAITLPLPSAGLPAGLMLIGRRGDDALLLSAATEVEAAIALGSAL